MVRISTSTIFDLGIKGMQQQTSDLVKLNEQIASGRRILTPKDDPIGASRALELSQSVSLNTQYDTNTNSANSSLGLEENTLTSVGELLNSVRTVAVHAGNGTLSHNDLVSLATELRGDYQELLGLANTTDGNGQYMFSGYQGATKPFSETSPGNVQYNGDQGQRLVQVTTSRQVPVNDPGSDVFMQIKNGNGTFVTAAAATNTGTAVIGPGTVTNPVSWATLAISKDYSVQFRNLPTSVSGTALVAGQEIEVSDPTAWSGVSQNASVSFGAGGYTVTANGTTAGPIAYGAAPIKIQGVGLSFNFAPAVGSSYTVSGSAVSYDLIDNTTGNSLITNAVPAPTGALPRTYIPGQDIAFTNLAVPAAGSDYGISATVSGTPANGDTLTVKASTNESIFTTLNNLITSLETANVPTGQAALSNNLNTALSNLYNDLNQVLTVRSSIGARMNEVTAVKNTGQDIALQYQQTLSGLQDLDYTKALSDFSLKQIALTAAQKSFVSIQGLSLFNYIQ